MKTDVDNEQSEPVVTDLGEKKKENWKQNLIGKK